MKFDGFLSFMLQKKAFNVGVKLRKNGFNQLMLLDLK